MRTLLIVVLILGVLNLVGLGVLFVGFVPPAPPMDEGPGEEMVTSRPGGWGPGRARRGPGGKEEDRAGPERRGHWADPEQAKRTAEDERTSRELDRLTGEYRRAPEERRKELEGEIRGLLDKQFDLRQEIRNAWLERLTTRLERLREHLARREKEREEMIKQQLERRLHQETDGVPEW